MMQPNTSPLPAFARRLKRQRIAIGLKQAALAHLLGLNQTTVSRWESGRQIPDPAMQQRALECVAARRTDDVALKRLVESSTLAMHLVDDADHTCLAYSKRRARDWHTTGRQMLGTSLWRFATDEIRKAEQALATQGWWDEALPAPRKVFTSEAIYPELRISPGGMLWERIYLADGTPARLVTGIDADA
ncbi:helix-turn-helix transcriptional regulator [Tropicimonas sp. TH_r6]|uniref:helix-turn-helix domain-containing protein n=1 Tax=Tropicimonas sp. TH_r6 TaxID=3082085 RepID=UPI0029534415|nr:helix-turn-helix transcriptional regulator [Tropicimonas sp. TH_r6]MDV7142147.1 helix-turn-helix transcriptional regulator [Tropicimonas sp. TH_r6]